jgi:hypothetical protein
LAAALVSCGVPVSGSLPYTLEHIRRQHTRPQALEAFRWCTLRDTAEAGRIVYPNSGRFAQALREGLRPQGPATLAEAIAAATRLDWTTGEALNDTRHPYDLARLDALTRAGITGRNAARLAWLFPLDYIAANIGAARKDAPKAGPGLIVQYIRENRANFDAEAAHRAAFVQQMQQQQQQAARAAQAARVAAEHQQQQQQAVNFARQLAALTDPQAAEALEICLAQLPAALARPFRNTAAERGPRAALASRSLSSNAAAAVLAVSTGARRTVPAHG